MRIKSVAFREAAAKSIDRALDYYLREGGRTPAARFVAALEDAYTHIRRFPATGSSRYAEELGIAGLRFWPLKKFPYLVFYIERQDCVDVLELLHDHQDIPMWLQSENKTQ